jgi:glycosyltransferase involved in cell wall biosynthesis
MMTFQTTVAIAAIPPRADNLLREAVNSVYTQELKPVSLAIAMDGGRHGAAHTRQRALDMVRTEWVTFLDDDDLLYPNHIATHALILEENDADFAYSWFDGNNPFPMHRGRQFNHSEPHHTTMTVTVRTEIAQSVGFLLPDGPLHQDWMGEDWLFVLGCSKAGAKFIGTGEITWFYRVHGTNTSGLPTRW